MMIAEHVSFDHLPSECKFLLFIVATGANLKSGNGRRQSEQALTSIVRGFWNDSALAPAELGNLNGLTEQLCMYYNSTRTTQD